MQIAVSKNIDYHGPSPKAFCVGHQEPEPCQTVKVSKQDEFTLIGSKSEQLFRKFGMALAIKGLGVTPLG